MDAGQIFATGGATGTVGVVLFLVYKFLTTKHRIRSNCFGKVVEIETEASSPPDKNISVIVDGSNNPITRRQEVSHFFKKNDVGKTNQGGISGRKGEGEVQGDNRPASEEGRRPQDRNTSTEPLPEPRE